MCLGGKRRKSLSAMLDTGYVAIDEESRTRWRTVRLVLAGGVAMVLALTAFHHDTTPALSAASYRPQPQPEEKPTSAAVDLWEEKKSEEGSRATIESLQFRLYKVALSTRVGDSEVIREFVNETIAMVDPNFDLGCDGVKINGYLLPYGPQLHWVQSAILSNDPDPVESWQPYFEELNRVTGTTLNAFQHNKVSMFTPDLSKMLSKLRSLNVDVVLRRSAGYLGTASPVGEVGHVLFEITGRAFEVAGPVTEDLLEDSRTWATWGFDECEAAHRLDANLDEYVREYAKYTAEASDDMQAWAAQRGYYPPMLAFVGVAASDDDVAVLRRTLFSDLRHIAGLDTVRELVTDACDVYRVPAVSSKSFKSPVRYVVNRAAMAALVNTDMKTVADYNDYIATTHSAITGAYRDWAGWDHWLDQHIGLKYVGDSNDAKAIALNANLSASGVPVGQRTTADYGNVKAVHWYVGYAGPMTWEYWVSDVSDYSTNGEADVCACVPSNNELVFQHLYGANCTDLGDWYR